MKKGLLSILLISILLLSLCGCADSSSDTEPITTTEEITTMETTEPEEDTETPTEPSEIPKTITPVKENFMAGSLVFPGAEVWYSYVAPINGVYRFDFDINSIENNYKFILSNEKDEVLIETQYNYRNDGGVSCSLSENETYYINIIQLEGEPEYSVKIGIPEKTKQISGDTFSGKLSYIDKCDSFTFKPQVDGIYRFDFDTTNVNYNYRFEMYTPKQESVCDVNYNCSNNGVSAYLYSEIEYTIYVSQKEGLPEYEISIGIPKEKSAVKNGIFSGKINYIDQCDLYSYKLSKGEYQVQFKNINSDSEVKIRVLSAKQENIFERSNTTDIVNFNVETGGVYEIQVEQRYGYTDYDIVFTKV